MQKTTNTLIAMTTNTLIAMTTNTLIAMTFTQKIAFHLMTRSLRTENHVVTKTFICLYFTWSQLSFTLHLQRHIRRSKN